MIITCNSGGRTRPDCQRLVRHLENRKDNQSIHVLELGNTVANTLVDAIYDMQLLRDGGSAQVALHHLTINPASHCDSAALRAVANMVRAELDPELSRPYAIIVHEKRRQLPGRGEYHAHLVLGHVDSKGRAIKDGRSKQRTEYVARLAEHHMSTKLGYINETPVLGRHFDYALRRMQEEAPKAAEWHAAVLDLNAERPVSAMSTATRQRAKRLGLNLPAARAKIVAAWQEAPDCIGFLQKLQEGGFVVSSGQKAGVWVIADTQGRQVGAVDRILGLRRREFNERMNESDVKQFLEQYVLDRRAGESPFTANHTAHKAPGGSGHSSYRSGRPDTGIPRSLGRTGNTSERSIAAGERKTGRASEYRFPAALSILRRVGLQLAANPVFSAEYLSRLHSANGDVWRGAHDIWNIPIEANRHKPSL